MKLEIKLPKRGWIINDEYGFFYSKLKPRWSAWGGMYDAYGIERFGFIASSGMMPYRLYNRRWRIERDGTLTWVPYVKGER